MEAITDPGLLLKITPPKLRRTLLVRERLRRLGTADDVSVIVIESPAGYGKTSLMAQWRLDWLQAGAAVGWLNLDAAESPITLASGIALGLRRSLGRPGFGGEAIETLRRGAGAAAGLTSLLAEITEASRPMALVLDNGERLEDAEAVEALDYLLHNLPPNLRVVIGTRPPARTEVLDLLGQGLLRRMTVADLRFNLAETIEFMMARFNGRIETDLCARLQDITAGWPLGLQLATAALERAADPQCAIEEFSRSRNDATQHLFEKVVRSLPNELGEFLVRCALLDALHPALCEAVTGNEDASFALQRLLVETPLLSATEEGEWLRLHPLAREYLASRAAETLPDDERRDIRVRAWRWLAAHGLPEQAARQALNAGFHSEALELVTRTLVDELEEGHQGKVVEWLARFPPGMIEASEQLRLIRLWTDAVSNRVADVEKEAARFIDDPSVDAAARNEARVGLACALFIADRRDEACRHIAEAERAVLNRRSGEVLLNLKAHAAFDAGEFELSRRYLRETANGSALPVVQIWRDTLVGISYLLEGRPSLAEQCVRSQHAQWEAREGRRAPWVVHAASVLGAACWQQDLRAEARVVLADRLDVIERVSGFRFVIHAYLTLARIAACEGDDSRAATYLESLAANGERGGTIRYVAVSLAERIRLNVARQRYALAAELIDKLEAVAGRHADGTLRAQHLSLELEMARAYFAVATRDPAGMGTHPVRARELVTRLNRGYEAVQVLALEALVAERAGESPDALLTEALSRAESGGLVRVFADTLPELVELIRRRTQNGPMGAVTGRFIGRVLAAAESTAAGELQPAAPGRSALLTPKEGQVLQLLAGGLHNKQIATELELSNDTVKWHVKKLFAKLNAGSREHAVDRARMLGLLR